MLLLVQSYAPDKAPYINCLEPPPSQLASTFGSWFFLLLVRLNLGFILRETCCCAHHTFLLGFPTGWLPRAHQGSSFDWKELAEVTSKGKEAIEEDEDEDGSEDGDDAADDGIDEDYE
jgi:hypothetical protein